MDVSRYFDNAATTPVDPRVREAMLPFLGEAFGNANSIHSWGLQAHEAVERARAQVAELIGAEDPSQVYFTSGATEANNWVLGIPAETWISPFEHSAMLEPGRRQLSWMLDNDGTTLSAPGPASPDSPPTERLLSVMTVNNEIGAVWDVREIAARAPALLLHSDITQAVGKIAITVEGLDFASFSAHKFYGPKGIGALYCKDQPPPPLILGGEQEQGYRGGTLNVPAIVGMGNAAEIAIEQQPKDHEAATELRGILLDELRTLSDWRMNPQSTIHNPQSSSPFILSLCFLGLQGESIVLEMDRAGYAISAGAACSSRSTEPSHVLRALNLEPEWLRGTVRISFGRFNSKEATASLGKKLRQAVEMFRTL